MESVVAELAGIADPSLQLWARAQAGFLLPPRNNCAVLYAALPVEHVPLPIAVVDFDVVEL